MQQEFMKKKQKIGKTNKSSVRPSGSNGTAAEDNLDRGSLNYESTDFTTVGNVLGIVSDMQYRRSLRNMMTQCSNPDYQYRKMQLKEFVTEVDVTRRKPFEPD